MTGDDELARIADLVLGDPAVQAAKDQLNSAARDHRPVDEAQRDAIGTVVRIAIQRAIKELGIPPEDVPATLEAAARYFENPPTD